MDWSRRANLEDRTEMQGVSSDPEDLVDSTGPVNRRDPPAGVTEVVITNPVPECVIFAARKLLIGSSGSESLNRLLVGGVVEEADGVLEGRQRVPEAS